MSVDLLSETSSSRGISPRISFSHDLKNSETVPIESNNQLRPSLLDYDFDFCVSKRRSDQDSTLADELFANGVILPIQIKRKNIPFISRAKPSSLPPLPPQFLAQNTTENGHSKEIQEKEKQSNNNNINNNNNEENKSFWIFKRSKSLNCGKIYKRGLCSLPILSRSKSTGSSTSVKKSLIPKEEVSNNSNVTINGKNSSSLKNFSHQKPPLKKNYSGNNNSFNNGLIQVNPIINVPSLFGFGYIFSSGNKGKKK